MAERDADAEIPTCFAERDPTVARVAETALRMMGGCVPPSTRKRIREMAAASQAAYPWSEVVSAVLSDDLDPSVMVQKGLGAQRDWVVKGVGLAPGAGSTAAPRSSPSFGYRIKRFLAVNLARLIFLSVFAVILVVLLVVAKRAVPALDIYELPERALAFVRGLFS